MAQPITDEALLRELEGGGNVPQPQAAQVAQQNAEPQAAPAPAPTEDRGFFGNVANAWNRGRTELAGGLMGSAAAIDADNAPAGQKPPAQSYHDRELARKLREHGEKKQAFAVENWRDIDSLGKAGTFVAEQLVSGLPGMAGDIATLPTTYTPTTGEIYAAQKGEGNTDIARAAGTAAGALGLIPYGRPFARQLGRSVAGRMAENIATGSLGAVGSGAAYEAGRNETTDGMFDNALDYAITGGAVSGGMRAPIEISNKVRSFASKTDQNIRNAGGDPELAGKDHIEAMRNLHRDEELNNIVGKDLTPEQRDALIQTRNEINENVGPSAFYKAFGDLTDAGIEVSPEAMRGIQVKRGLSELSPDYGTGASMMGLTEGDVRRAAGRRKRSDWGYLGGTDFGSKVFSPEELANVRRQGKKAQAADVTSFDDIVNQLNEGIQDLRLRTEMGEIDKGVATQRQREMRDMMNDANAIVKAMNDTKSERSLIYDGIAQRAQKLSNSLDRYGFTVGDKGFNPAMDAASFIYKDKMLANQDPSYRFGIQDYASEPLSMGKAAKGLISIKSLGATELPGILARRGESKARSRMAGDFEALRNIARDSDAEARVMGARPTDPTPPTDLPPTDVPPTAPDAPVEAAIAPEAAPVDKSVAAAQEAAQSVPTATPTPVQRDMLRERGWSDNQINELNVETASRMLGLENARSDLQSLASAEYARTPAPVEEAPVAPNAQAWPFTDDRVPTLDELPATAEIPSSIDDLRSIASVQEERRPIVDAPIVEEAPVIATQPDATPLRDLWRQEQEAMNRVERQPEPEPTPEPTPDPVVAEVEPTPAPDTSSLREIAKFELPVQKTPEVNTGNKAMDTVINQALRETDTVVNQRNLAERKLLEERARNAGLSDEDIATIRTGDEISEIAARRKEEKKAADQILRDEQKAKAKLEADELRKAGASKDVNLVNQSRYIDDLATRYNLDNFVMDDLKAQYIDPDTNALRGLSNSEQKSLVKEMQRRRDEQVKGSETPEETVNRKSEDDAQNQVYNQHEALTDYADSLGLPPEEALRIIEAASLGQTAPMTAATLTKTANKLLQRADTLKTRSTAEERRTEAKQLAEEKRIRAEESKEFDRIKKEEDAAWKELKAQDAADLKAAQKAEFDAKRKAEAAEKKAQATKAKEDAAALRAAKNEEKAAQKEAARLAERKEANELREKQRQEALNERKVREEKADARYAEREAKNDTRYNERKTAQEAQAAQALEAAKIKAEKLDAPIQELRERVNALEKAEKESAVSVDEIVQRNTPEQLNDIAEALRADIATANTSMLKQINEFVETARAAGKSTVDVEQLAVQSKAMHDVLGAIEYRRKQGYGKKISGANGLYTMDLRDKLKAAFGSGETTNYMGAANQRAIALAHGLYDPNRPPPVYNTLAEYKAALLGETSPIAKAMGEEAPKPVALPKEEVVPTQVKADEIVTPAKSVKVETKPVAKVEATKVEVAPEPVVAPKPTPKPAALDAVMEKAKPVEKVESKPTNLVKRDYNNHAERIGAKQAEAFVKNVRSVKDLPDVSPYKSSAFVEEVKANNEGDLLRGMVQLLRENSTNVPTLKEMTDGITPLAEDGSNTHKVYREIMQRAEAKGWGDKWEPEAFREYRKSQEGGVLEKGSKADVAKAVEDLTPTEADIKAVKPAKQIQADEMVQVSNDAYSVAEGQPSISEAFDRGYEFALVDPDKNQIVTYMKSEKAADARAKKLGLAAIGLTTFFSGSAFAGGMMGAYGDALGKRESGGNYGIENTLGYVGKYQFGWPALVDLGLIKREGRVGKGQKSILNEKSNWTGKYGVKSKEEFLRSPEAQEKAFEDWNKMLDRRTVNMGLDKYVGKVVDGVPITMEGLRAASHLLGHGAVKTALQTGNLNAVDGYGTKMSEYIKLGNKTSGLA